MSLPNEDTLQVFLQLKYYSTIISPGSHKKSIVEVPMKPLRNLILALIVLVFQASPALCGDMPGPTVPTPPPPQASKVTAIKVAGVEILLRILGL